ncbi:hypothetical protein CONLIGDRAFT_212863 [Coniochaeta ligniaria NRRL 30616]|uniref:Uncharacterized protein n=1 Tax=Coniochaeta ligniaria NRRL 30616 TaxID=1408157 RepID=A0A1J7J326_9PEZI|nr:hypothetical protein CONLIGDRAFT_212863 [Coniochaeta ligniaria NRRL 30616]
MQQGVAYPLEAKSRWEHSLSIGPSGCSSANGCGLDSTHCPCAASTRTRGKISTAAVHVAFLGCGVTAAARMRHPGLCVTPSNLESGEDAKTFVQEGCDSPTENELTTRRVTAHVHSFFAPAPNQIRGLNLLANTAMHPWLNDMSATRALHNIPEREQRQRWLSRIVDLTVRCIDPSVNNSMCLSTFASLPFGVLLTSHNISSLSFPPRLQHLGCLFDLHTVDHRPRFLSCSAPLSDREFSTP